MISKLLQYEYSYQYDITEINTIKTQLIDYFKLLFGSDSKVEIIRQDPFKFLYHIFIDNLKTYFVKVIYSNDELIQRIILDNRIQSFISKQFKVSIIKKKFNDKNLVIVIRDFIVFNNNPMDIGKILSITSSYGQEKNLFRFVQNSDFSFEFLFKKSVYALDYLFNSKQISKETLHLVKQLYETTQLTKYDNSFFCHGDLHDGNILSYQNDLLLIDWEDSMAGPKDYDLIYWLTSYKNQYLINKSVLKDNKIFNNCSLRTFIMIILLKSFLSIKNHQIINHKLSIEDRINYIFKVYST